MSRVRYSRSLAAGLWWLVASLFALLLGLYVAGGTPQIPVQGLPTPDPVVSWGVPILRFFTLVCGIATVGFLIVYRWLSLRPVLVPFIALLWATLALAQVFFVLANILALPLTDALSPAIAATYATEITSTRALIASAVIAFIVSFGVLASRRSHRIWIVLAVTSVVLPSMANHSSGLGDHALALTGNALHSAAAAIWVGVFLVLTATWLQQVSLPASVLKSYSNVALTAWLILALSGMVNGYVRLETPGQLLMTGYGQLLIGKAALLILIGFVGWRIKLRFVAQRTFPFLALVDLTLLAAATGFGIALASSGYPRLPVTFASVSEALLGSAPPDAPTVITLLFGYRLSPAFVVAILFGLGLVISRWRIWPPAQRTLFLLGLGLLFWTTNGGPALYAPVSPGWAAIQLGLMLGPVALLLVRGWPGHRIAKVNIYAATIIVIAVQIIGAVLGGWTTGSYLTRTLLLLAMLATGALFFTQNLRTHSGRLASITVLATSIALSVAVGGRVAPWFEAVQPVWLTDLESHARIGAWWAVGVFGASILAAQLFPGRPQQWPRQDSNLRHKV